MKGKQNGGFTLVEVLVAMAILTSIVIPVCSSLVLSTRIDAKAEAVLQARLAVSSALETMMAEGIDPERIKDGNYDLDGDDQEEALYIKVIKVGNENDTPYYNVEVSDPNGLVTMTTCIREAITNPENSGEQEGGGGQ